MIGGDLLAVERAIRNGSEDVACDVAAAGPGHWKVIPESEGEAAVEVRLSDDWVLFETEAIRPRVGNDVEALLQWNFHLPGACKFVLANDPKLASLRVEVPVVNDVAWAIESREALSHLAAAQRLMATRRKPRAKSTASKRPSKRATAALAEVLAEVCEESDLGYSQREDGRPVVTLNLRDASYSSVGEARSQKDYRFCTRLTRYQSLTETARRAVAAFLLTVNGAVRFVRAGLEEAAEGLTAFVEARFSRCPTPAQLDVGLSALAVACSMCDRELRVLADEQVANRYLTAWGYPRSKRGRCLCVGEGKEEELIFAPNIEEVNDVQRDDNH